MQKTLEAISNVQEGSLAPELENVSSRYVTIACWVAIIFDPIFSIVDYINIPDYWESLLIARVSVAALIALAYFLRKPLRLTSATLVSVPLLLISLQNAYVYMFIGPEHALAQNLNFIALLIGASLFLLWKWSYSVLVVLVAGAATAFFLSMNPNLTINTFFLKGGLLLLASAIFMIILINARYNLTLKEIKARIALTESLAILKQQADEIKRINENLEQVVKARTSELENKNRLMEEYAFITAHKLRGPVASVLGLITVFRSLDLKEDAKEAVGHLDTSSMKLDAIVNSMIRTIEQGDHHNA